MRKTYISRILILFIVLSCARLSAQTTTTGTQTASAVINFNQIAQYYASHPQPKVRKNFPEPDDEGRPLTRPAINPADRHTRAQASRMPSSLRTPLLPVSPAPLDSFECAVSDGTSIPPDTHGAVDSTYVVSADNMAVTIQNHSGTQISQTTLDQFWNSVLPSGTTGSFDPRIQYDMYAKRWIIVALCDGQNSNSSLLVGISQTNDPTGSWNLFRVLIDATGQNWLDFPNVGFNKKWVVVSGNMFPNTGSGSGGARVYCFNKANIMSNTNANHTIINQTNSFSICPAFIYDSTQLNMWAIESYDGAQSSLRLWKITGAVGSEVMTSVGFPSGTINWQQTSYAVTGTSGADFAPQTGTTHKIQTNDDRMNNLTYRNGKLWCSQIVFLPYSTSSNPTRASSQWWQMDTLANPLQIGLIDDPTSVNFYAFPSISVNKNDDALIGFTHFSSSIHPSAAYALHLHTDPIDSMRPLHTFRPGQATYYQTFGGSDDRWGDYSATVFDPVNETDFWTIQEASATGNLWDTWWAHVVICTTPSAPTSVTLPTAPCTGATAVYTVPAVTGATSYTWSISGTGWSGTSTTNSITLTAGTGSATVSVTANSSCASSTAYTFTAPHGAVPAAPTSVTLPTAPCPNTTAVYTVPAVTGATSYTWSISGTGWSGTSTTNSITLTAGTSAATVSVTANNSCGASTAYTFNAPLGPAPTAPTSVTLPTAPCTGATAVYTVPAVTGATSYTWSTTSTGWSGTSTTNSITLTAGTSAGTVSVTANNACGSSTAYVFTAPHGAVPAAPTSVTLPTAPCTGATAVYTVPAVTGATSYTWSTTSTGWSGTSTTNSITLTAGTGAGTVSVTANNACGSSTAYVFTAPHGAVPAAPTSVTLPTAPCSGNTASYSVPAVTGATSYTWSTSSPGWSGTSTTRTITLTAGSSAGTISVTANNSCGSSTAYVFTAPLGPVPAAPTSATLPTAPCPTTSAVYSVPAVTGATSYTWSISGTGWSGTSTTRTITLTAGTVPATVSVTANNTCGSSTAYVFTAPLGPVPAAPTSATLPTAPCPTTSAVYSVPAVTGATSYTWSISGTGWSGTSTTNTITLTAGTVSGSVSVTANNACGSSTAYVFTAPLGPVPAAPTSVTLPTAPCTSATAVYTVPAVTGATSYTWSVSGTGWSGTSTTNSITLTAGTGSASVSVTANNLCGSSTAYVFTAPHGAAPSAPTSVTLPTAPCATHSAVYTVPAVTGATSYTWSVSGTGWSGTSTTNSITLTAGTGSASVSVTANNGCGSSTAYVFTAPSASPPATPSSVTLPTAPCTNSTAVYTVPAVTGATSYTWTVSGAGWSGTSTTNSITLTAGTVSASVSVIANNACGSSAPYTFTAPIGTGGAPAAAASISAPSVICTGQTATFTTPAISGATTYNWTYTGTGWTGSSTTNSITLTSGTGTIAISVNGVNGCGSGQSYSLANVAVVATPVASFTESTHSTVTLSGVSIVFTGIAPLGSTYSWNFNGGNATPGTGAGPQTVDWTTTGTKTVTLSLDNGGCLSSTYSDTVQVEKSTGIGNLQKSTIDAINIIPNPTSGMTQFVIEANAETTINVEIYDMTGRIVGKIYNGNIDAGRKVISFDTEDFSAGIYVVRASDGWSSIQSRFTKL